MAGPERREFVRIERRGDRAIVTLDEPDRLNPLPIGLTLRLQDRLTADRRIRAVVVLTGADPAFCAGVGLSFALAMEEYAEADCFSTRTLGAAAAGIR